MKNKTIEQIEEILKNANLESMLSLEALQSVAKLKQDILVLEEKIEKNATTLISNKNTIDELNTKLDIYQNRENDLETREKDVANRSIQVEAQEFKIAYLAERGNEMKEILGMALKNTEIKKSIFSSQSGDTGNGYRNMASNSDETTTKE